MSSLRPRALTMTVVMVLAAALLLAACGGGLYIGIGVGGGIGGDAPPSVGITTAATRATPGGGVRVLAAAADDHRIDNVAFYRVDSGSNVRLGSIAHTADDRYEWSFDVPDDGRTSLAVFARATDDAGQQGDSALLTLPIVR